jgi:hypothetical protein
LIPEQGAAAFAPTAVEQVQQAGAQAGANRQIRKRADRRWSADGSRFKFAATSFAFHGQSPF